MVEVEVEVRALEQCCPRDPLRTTGCTPAPTFHVGYPRKRKENNCDIGNKGLSAVKVALEEWRHWLEGTD